MARSAVSESFRRVAHVASNALGTHWAFIFALACVIAWLFTGPLFAFDEQWQLIINTGTTVITFLMVFLIQATQNRESRATQLELEELIRATKSASNAFADLEDATEDELKRAPEAVRAAAAARTREGGG